MGCRSDGFVERCRVGRDRNLDLLNLEAISERRKTFDASERKNRQ